VITEAQIRALSKSVLTMGPYPEALVRDELGLLHGENRVDVAMLTDQQLVGIEVKSDSDNLKRLPDQCLAYSAVFDRVELFVASKHFDEAAASDYVPSWFGLWAVREAKSGLLCDHYRRAKNNPGDYKPLWLAQLMWADENKAALRHHQKLPKGGSSWTVARLNREVAMVLTLGEIRTEVRAALRVRSLSKGGFAKEGWAKKEG
jgi:hypothetical protein